jgi:WD40 repeat protein
MGRGILPAVGCILCSFRKIARCCGDRTVRDGTMRAPDKWPTVRIFVSSTFRDMHSERDHLVRVVFPELRERLEALHIRLIDVDLRWGVPEEETMRGRALSVCLDEVERCKPFFIGLLSERYGWVPPSTATENLPDYDWLTQLSSGLSITELEIHGALRRGTPARAFFYFRDPAFLETIPEASRGNFVSENVKAAAGLARLKKSLRASCQVTDYRCTFEGTDDDGRVRLGMSAFGERVLDDLWGAISSEVRSEESGSPDALPAGSPDAEFVDSRAQLLVGRDEAIAGIRHHLETGEGTLLMVGPGGVGKSAVLVAAVNEFRHRHPDRFAFIHFAGAASGSTAPAILTRRLVEALSQHAGMTEPLPEQDSALRAMMPDTMAKAAQRGPISIVVDALDQLDLEPGSDVLDWLPTELPPGVRVVVSVADGPTHAAVLKRGTRMHELRIEPLPDADRRTLVRSRLAQYRKRLGEDPPAEGMSRLVTKRDAGLPLYLVLACEELRVYGVFERVDDRIDALPQTTEALFEQLLSRLEVDHGRELVARALGLVACARDGILESELLDLLSDGAARFPHTRWARLRRSVSAYLRPTRKETGELVFFHRAFTDAVAVRYFADARARAPVHSVLAAYFAGRADPSLDGRWAGRDPRPLAELVFHLASAGDTARLQTVLSDLRFIASRCATRTVRQLERDYGLAWPMLPAAARDHLLPWRMFLRATLHLLSRSSPSWPSERILMQQAWENGPESVARAAAAWLVEQESTQLWLLAVNRAPSGGTLAVFEGHQGPVRGAVTLGSRMIASYSDDGTVRLWDETGTPRAVLPAHAAINGIRCVQAPDGGAAFERLLSWSHAASDNTAKVWDPVNGACLRTIDLAGRHRVALDEVFDGELGFHTRDSGSDDASTEWIELSAVDRPPSGGRFYPYSTREIMVGGGGSIALPGGREAHWKARVPPPMESQSDFALRIASDHGDGVRFEGHTDEVHGALVLDPVTLLSWSRDRTLRLWNLNPLGPAGVLVGHQGAVVAVIRIGERHVLSCSEDGTMRLWDSTARQDSGASVGHKGTVTHDLVVNDHRLLTWRVSTDDQKAILWNTDDGRIVATLEHRSEIDGAALIGGERILTWSRGHWGFYAGGNPGMYDLSGLGTTYADYMLWSVTSGRPLGSVDRAAAVRLFPNLDGVEYREEVKDIGLGVSIGITTRDAEAETANAQREVSGPCQGVILRTDGRSVALTESRASGRAEGPSLAEWHSSARLSPGPIFTGGTVAVYEEGGAVRFLGLRRGPQRTDWHGNPRHGLAPIASNVGVTSDRKGGQSWRRRGGGSR